MIEQITELIAEYGLETVCLALIVNALTAVIKIPIKLLAKRTKDSANITRFIVFLPFVIGFASTFAYCKWIANGFSFGKEFVTLWLTSSSLSLTFYAVFEKLTPQKNKKGKTSDDGEKTQETAVQETEKQVEHSEKIILRGNSRNKTK